MNTIKKWGGCIFAVLFLAALSLFLWHTSRPVTLRAEELTPATPAGEGNAYPGTSLSLELGTDRIQSATFTNDSDTIFEHGDPPDRSGLEVLLEDSWYHVSHKAIYYVGVGKITEPGNTFTFEPIQEPYGKLPDGQYRLSFSYMYFDPEWERALVENPDYAEYTLYARFDITDGKYVPA